MRLTGLKILWLSISKTLISKANFEALRSNKTHSAIMEQQAADLA